MSRLPPDDEIVRRAKVELRKRMRGLRNTTPESACLERSRRIVASLLAHESVQNARTVALFWPILARHEVDLRTLDDALRARGVALAYPSIDPETREMTFRVFGDCASLEQRGLGFEEPPPDAPVAEALDVIVAPALAAEPRGYRLGYGAGFYDRAMPAWAPPAVTIAVCFEFQLLVELPVGEGDVPVHWIVTDARVMRAENAPLDPP